MILDFLYPDNDKDFRKEMERIIKVEVEKHFNFEDIISFQNNYNNNSVHIEILNAAYYNDIEKAKGQLYEDKNNGEEVYMKDFISEVQENLSFVPEIKVR